MSVCDLMHAAQMLNASIHPAIIRVHVPKVITGMHTLAAPMWMNVQIQMHVAQVPFAQTSKVVIAATALKVSTVMHAPPLDVVTKMNVPSLHHADVMPCAKMR